MKPLKYLVFIDFLYKIKTKLLSLSMFAHFNANNLKNVIIKKSGKANIVKTNLFTTAIILNSKIYTILNSTKALKTIKDTNCIKDKSQILKKCSIKIIKTRKFE